MVLIFEDKTNSFYNPGIYCTFIGILFCQYAGYVFSTYATKPLIDFKIRYLAHIMEYRYFFKDIINEKLQ